MGQLHQPPGVDRLLVTAALGLVGFLDDWRSSHDDRSPSAEVHGRAGDRPPGLYLYRLPHDGVTTQPRGAVGEGLGPNLGAAYVPFVTLVIVGASNAVNLTDGLDGLAIGPVTINAATYMLFAYVAGHATLSAYLQIPRVVGAGELAVMCGAMVGAGLGFLWFNSYPAEVFMGDVGSLSLGGTLGTIAVLTKQEILLVIVGGVFVVEALSVIFQVGSYKYRGKRIFRMAPIHHHFELKGVAGTEDHRALLDHHHHPGAGGDFDTEDEVMNSLAVRFSWS